MLLVTQLVRVELRLQTLNGVIPETRVLVYMDCALSCSKEKWAQQEISDSGGLLAALKNIASLLPVVNT